MPVITMVQVLDVPVHAPDQPANVEFLFAVAMRVTVVPWINIDPDGFVVTAPPPDLLTVSV